MAICLALKSFVGFVASKKIKNFTDNQNVAYINCALWELCRSYARNCFGYF